MDFLKIKDLYRGPICLTGTVIQKCLFILAMPIHRQFNKKEIVYLPCVLRQIWPIATQRNVYFSSFKLISPRKLSLLGIVWPILMKTIIDISI
jgi:hypothetical protein